MAHNRRRAAHCTSSERRAARKLQKATSAGPSQSTCKEATCSHTSEKTAPTCRSTCPTASASSTSRQVCWRSQPTEKSKSASCVPDAPLCRARPLRPDRLKTILTPTITKCHAASRERRLRPLPCPLGNSRRHSEQTQVGHSHKQKLRQPKAPCCVHKSARMLSISHKCLWCVMNIPYQLTSLSRISHSHLTMR